MGSNLPLRIRSSGRRLKSVFTDGTFLETPTKLLPDYHTAARQTQSLGDSGRAARQRAAMDSVARHRRRKGFCRAPKTLPHESSRAEGESTRSEDVGSKVLALTNSYTRPCSRSTSHPSLFSCNQATLPPTSRSSSHLVTQ